MIYRCLIKRIRQINGPFVHKFAYLYSYLFCKLCHFLPIKFPLPQLPVKVMGLSFANPVGLAAGFDCQGKFLAYSAITGFGFIEIGTVNIDPHYQASQLIKTIDKVAKKNHDFRNQPRWGINLGSLRNTLEQESVADYIKGMDLFWCHVDYLVINFSRPGSPARKLQPNIKEIDSFLAVIKQHHQQLAILNHKYTPIVVKLGIDQNNNRPSKELLALIKKHRFDGVIVAFENWPETQTRFSYLRSIKAVVEDLPIIVVGGIRTMTEVRQMLDAGASLVQLYTHFVQNGPLIMRRDIATITPLK